MTGPRSTAPVTGPGVEYVFNRSGASDAVEKTIHDKTGQFQQSAERLRRALDATLDAIAEEMRRQNNLAAARDEIDAHVRRDGQAGRP